VIATMLGGIAVSPLMRTVLRYGAIVLAVLLFLLSLRRSGERARRLAGQLDAIESTRDVQRRMATSAWLNLFRLLAGGGFARHASGADRGYAVPCGYSAPALGRRNGIPEEPHCHRQRDGGLKSEGVKG